MNYRFLLICFIFLLSCEDKRKDILYLKYIKENQQIHLQLKNNTGTDIIFLVPNSLEFSDRNYKSYSTRGSREEYYPINVYAVINQGQSSKKYQRKLDSVRNTYLAEIGNENFLGDERPGDGHTVLFLKNNDVINVKYNLFIKSVKNLSQSIYSSKFKQNYYPYDKVLKGNYPEGEYLKRFSKLNFGNAKFVAQPVIEDSLVLKLSEKDITN
ncbi:hypothetical protein OWR28_20810 [Chryseobacterium sp. 1B4]